MWKWFEQYFTFTKSEKNGIIALVFLSVLIFLAPKVYLFFKPVEIADNSKYQKEVDAFVKEYNDKKQLALTDTSEDSKTEYNPYANVDLSSHFKKKEKREIEYFEFDPNKIGVAEWKKLGFSEKQAESIEKLKAKGFHFREPEDLKKVYVIGEENYARLQPYIKIAPNDFPKKEYPKTVYAEKVKEKILLDINVADSTAFEHQRGIGPSLARRIVNYRNKLGGFVSMEQMKEVWGLPDSTYQSLKSQWTLNPVTLSKINVNSADFDALRKHPYIGYPYAKVISAYHKQHGNFKSVSDLKTMPAMNDSIFKKVEPYLTVE